MKPPRDDRSDDRDFSLVRLGVPDNRRFRRLFGVLAAVAVVAASARIGFHLPLGGSEIPVTAQSLAVLLVGFLLPAGQGFLAISLYLILGAAGWGVFAQDAAGIAVLTGPRGGYLFGFAVASLIMGELARRGWGSTFGGCLVAMIIGTAVILAMGVARLSTLHGWEKAMEYGLDPFIAGAVIKIGVGAAIANVIWKYRSLSRSSAFFFPLRQFPPD